MESKSVVDQTSVLSKIKEAYIVKFTFYLPEDKFQEEDPIDTDLDNLLKTRFDIRENISNDRR